MKKTFSLLLLLPSLLVAQTIQEKKESLSKTENSLEEGTSAQLKAVNLEIEAKRAQLAELYDKSRHYFEKGAADADYLPLIEEIKACKQEISEIETLWRKESSKSEAYALWHQPEITLSQLVADYGAHHFAYLIPPEIASVTVSINSNLPIPRESWQECLELVLNQYGVGIRQLNPYLRELYLFKTEISCLACVTSDPKDLELLPDNSRLCFVLPIDSPDPKSALHFLQKFSNPNTTHLEIMHGTIFITSTVDSVKELLKLYAFTEKSGVYDEYRLVTLSKVDAKEMILILESAFGKKTGEEGPLRAMPLTSISHSLFLFGSKNEVLKAAKLIAEVEGQIEAPNAKTLFWYTTKHSDADELAQLLAKVYDLLVETPAVPKELPFPTRIKIEKPPAEKESNPLPIQPAAAIPLSNGARPAHRTSDGQNNFLVDKKTGSIIMVVEQSALPKLKELLKKLDVPKKMVQIEVLLFEKKITNQNKSGLNLLRLGQTASPKTEMGWNEKGTGILEFLISRAKSGSGIPSFDLAYHFLLGQEDVQINASPSVTTVNQTPATIAIVEEISINTGVDYEKTKERNSYSRAQYGITIQITPTINVGGTEEEEEEGFITLDTDITFDTTQKTAAERPDVTRRHIKNHVRIGDGQTVILGGLRRKNTQDKQDSIPFLGEIPGLGKLFSTTDLYESSTEMFVFITPKIICDASADAEKQRSCELAKRPGDVPEFLHELLDAKSREKRKAFQGGLTALFGKGASSVTPCKEKAGEYDGK